MSTHQFELVARIIKARGLEGEVTVRADGDLSLCLQEGLSVHVVPPSLYGPRDLVISEVRDFQDGSQGVKFSGYDTIDSVEELAGRYLLANADDLDVDLYDDEWFIGCQVIDEKYGDLGEATELIETPANDVLVVQGRYGEVLVPVVDEVVIETPQEDGLPIVTRLMEGLIESEPFDEGETR